MSEGQVNGVDYHFVTRRIFESEIVTNKYVEHGEYHCHYYGMSLESIRTVVNSSKIAVLNLNCGVSRIL
jgi:guanylate kinase